MRVLISGSRSWTEEDKIDTIIQSLDPEFDSVIHGGCSKGADCIANKLADQLFITTERYPAKWKREDGSVDYTAGHRRNQVMVDTKPDYAYFFWDGGSPGTRDCLIRAIKAGIPYEVIARPGFENQVSLEYNNVLAKIYGGQIQMF